MDQKTRDLIMREVSFWILSRAHHYRPPVGLMSSRSFWLSTMTYLLNQRTTFTGLEGVGDLEGKVLQSNQLCDSRH
ncbi:unnamed protein product, partial [Vitis vinifera]